MIIKKKREENKKMKKEPKDKTTRSTSVHI